MQLMVTMFYFSTKKQLCGDFWEDGVWVSSLKVCKQDVWATWQAQQCEKIQSWGEAPSASKKL